MISVPGQYAADGARKALKLGKNVMIFSDNVEVKDELELKQYAHEKGLLVMGPDCGTAIINGTGLVNPPFEVFEKAIVQLAERIN